MPDEYQAIALRTWHSATFPQDKQRLHAVLGLAGEAGEVAEQYKKHLFKPGRVTTRAQRLDELVDVFYYLLILMHIDDCTVDELSIMMREKLADGHGWEPNYCNGG